jgi:putative transposase
MDGRGRALDSIFTERFWRSLKYEEVYLNAYRIPREARQNVARCITFYNNTVRPPQALGYRTPAAVYAPTGQDQAG